MQVQNWMNPDTVTVDEDTPVVKVLDILEQNDIGHLPVMSGNRLVGIISEEDVKVVLPSKTAPIRARELHYLLAEMKARDVMKPDPVTIRPDDTMELAAVKMLEHKIGGLPVVTKSGKLVGIISQGDVFRVLISITGIYQGGVQFAFALEDRAGSIKEVADVMRDEGAQIVSILSTSDTADPGYRNVFIRVKKVPPDRLKRLVDRLKDKFMLLYMIEDPLKNI
jgi:acetoin utilization protein AcuB